MEKRRNCSKGAISPLFHNIFNICLTSRVQLHLHLLNAVVRFIFSSSLQIWYVEVRISRSIFESPLKFEITRVDCSYIIPSTDVCISGISRFLLKYSVGIVSRFTLSWSTRSCSFIWDSLFRLRGDFGVKQTETVDYQHQIVLVCPWLN